MPFRAVVMWVGTSRKKLNNFFFQDAQALKDILFLFCATRLALFLVGWLAMRILPMGVDFQQANFTYHQHTIAPLEMWARWDAEWYLLIAEKGYNSDSFYSPPYPKHTSASWFPLYPILIYGVRLLVRNSIVAGLLISNLCLLVALIALYKLVRFDFDEAIASRTVLYSLIFPTIIFFSAIYTESLFLALSVLSFYFLRRQQWVVAGLMGFLAALTRPIGILLLIPFLDESLSQKRFQIRKIGRVLLAAVLVVLGLGFYMVYLHFAVGDALAFAHAQSTTFGRKGFLPGIAIIKFLRHPAVHNPHASMIDFSMMLVALFVLLPEIFSKQRRSYGLYVLANLLLILCGSLVSTSRYLLTLFPLFIALALLGQNPRLHQAFVIFMSMLAALFMALFANWYWVA